MSVAGASEPGEVGGAWPFRRPGPPPTVPSGLTAHLVSHTHWDREWYSTAEWFRRRLVVTVDRVLDLLAADPDWAFVLDGQAIVVEDYLSARPSRAVQLADAVRSGRLAIGPWYVQPDSLLPAGEAHIRNLLEGRTVCAAFGGASRVAYTPDSFGHPGWFPTLFRGFDLSAFVYWRGHGSERDALPARWRWRAADGSEVLAWHLEGSYLAAATLEDDPEVAAVRLRDLASVLAARSPDHCLLMNGLDHAVPDQNTGGAATALAAITGWSVRRTTLDRAVEAVEQPAESWCGALVGARDANLLAGVWSSRLPIKLANRRVEAALWTAEHLCAVGALLGLADEQPTIRRVRRSMLENQAHDSIGGCSADAVHEEMGQRSSTAQSAARCLAAGVAEQLAGLGADHLAPWSDEWDVAVWNPLPWRRRETVRIPVEGWPAFRVRAHAIERHPGHMASLDGMGFSVDGRPARVLDAVDQCRDRFSPDQRLVDVEATVDLPALGWTRVRLSRGRAVSDVIDDGRSLANDLARIEVDEDGTLTYSTRHGRWPGLLAVVERGDRGDTYDRDLLDGDPLRRPVAVECSRRRGPNGGGEIVVRRRFEVPQRLDAARHDRVAVEVALDVEMVVSLSPVGRLDIDVAVVTTATDHIVALRVPMSGGHPVYATQFGEEVPSLGRSVDGWVHPPPDTFCHQGWIALDGLLVLAPGLPEAAIVDGAMDVTVLRAIGWMSRPDLRTRPGRASPAIPVPGAQCGEIRARLAFVPDPGDLVGRARSLAELEQPPVTVAAGDRPLVDSGVPLMEVHGAVVTAVKPADDGDGVVVRLWNPSSTTAGAQVDVTVPVTSTRCRLDEEELAAGEVEDLGSLALLAHEVRTLRLRRQAVVNHS